jgi:hypothetical protein
LLFQEIRQRAGVERLAVEREFAIAPAVHNAPSGTVKVARARAGRDIADSYTPSLLVDYHIPFIWHTEFAFLPIVDDFHVVLSFCH